MEQETTTNYPRPAEKIYKDREIWVGALLGGTLAAGYMVAANYRAFGEADKRRKTWFVTVAAAAFLFYISFFAPYLDRVPNLLFSLVCAGIIVVLVQMYQGAKIRAHIGAGGKIHSWWKTLGVTFVGGVISIVIFVGAATVIEYAANANITTRTYGTLRHEIDYDASNLTENEVDALAEALNKANFFDDDGKWYLFARKAENSYEITFSVTRKTLTDKQYLEFFTDLRNQVQTMFPDNKIVFNLAVGDFSKIEQRIE